jgi:hypothetical protein
MLEQTALRVHGNPNNVPPIAPVNHRDDIALWHWFVRAFKTAFTDTTRSEDALSKLLAIKMQGEDLDTYIATFDHLRAVAQWERDSRGTILLFRRGLNPALAQAVINRTIPRPETFDDWANAARTQHANWIESRAVMGTQNRGRDDGFRNPRWRQAITGTGNRSRRNDVVPMDVDLAELGKGRLSEAERKRLMAERRCFHCKAQGHISRECPRRGGQRTGGRPFQRPAAARATEFDDDATVIDAAQTTSSPDRKAVLKGIQGMSSEERNLLMEELLTNEATSSSF